MFSGSLSGEELLRWLDEFQASVDEVVGDDSVQFTMDAWLPDEESRELVPKRMNVVGEEKFPYLDSAMRWNEDDELCFGVHTKPNFQNKYLNAGSCHTAACKRAVPRGVSIRLAGLTTRTARNQNTSLSVLYPETDKALKSAGLLKEGAELPTLGQILDEKEREFVDSQLPRRQNGSDKRAVYCITRFEGDWRTPMHVTLQQLKRKYGFGWLRPRMCYRRHRNLREYLLADANAKLMRNIVDEDTKPQACNCQQRVRNSSGECIFGGQCRTAGVVYKITCKCCGDYYIGKTQRYVRKRTHEHVTDTGKFWSKHRDFEQAYNLIENDVDGVLSSHLSRQSNQSTATGATTRSRAAQAGRAQSQTGPTPLTTNSRGALSALLALFTPLQLSQSSQGATSPNLPPTINEGNESVSSDITGDFPPNSPIADEPSASPNATIAGSSQHSANDALLGNQFAAAFQIDGQDPLEVLPRLEAMRHQILEPQLENALKSIKTSTISRHMWSHARRSDESFNSKGELYLWVRNNISVEILTKGSPVTQMRTAATKNCTLCMKEKISLFHHFGRKRSRSHNLINSRNELYSKCSCRTRFLRLRAVGNVDADEATS